MFGVKKTCRKDRSRNQCNDCDSGDVDCYYSEGAYHRHECNVCGSREHLSVG